MACVWLCTDWHLTHKNMALKYRTGFSSIEEHDDYFIQAWKSNVTKRDKVICLGDMATSARGISILRTLPAEQKHLILGNHDLDSDCTIEDLMLTFSKITGPTRYKEFWLTHFPIHESELRGKINIHGHIHGELIDDPRYVNLCPEVLERVHGKPIIKLQDLRQLINSGDYYERQFVEWN